MNDERPFWTFRTFRWRRLRVALYPLGSKTSARALVSRPEVPLGGGPCQKVQKARKVQRHEKIVLLSGLSGLSSRGSLRGQGSRFHMGDDHGALSLGSSIGKKSIPIVDALGCATAFQN